MGDGFENAGEPLNECAGAVVRTAGLHRPIDEKWATHDGVAIDKSPVAAVGTLIAIVTHGEIFPGRDDDLVAPDMVLDVAGPFGNHLRGIQLVANRRKGVIQRIVGRGWIVHDVWLI